MSTDKISLQLRPVLISGRRLVDGFEPVLFEQLTGPDRFLSADDSRFAGTVQAIERDLRRGDFVFRYVEPDDFGTPSTALLACTFWYVNALAALGRRQEARQLFEKILACRNRHGLLAEDIDPRTREQWGNFVQTYSMVGLISAAIRLSVRWDLAF